MPQAAAKRSEEAPQSAPSLTLKRNISASPAKLFAAWTEPKLLTQWFRPETGSQVLLAEFDLRKGGRYAITVRTSDGADHHVHGVYREIQPNERLVFTWSGDCDGKPRPESLVTILIRPEGSGSVLTLIHEQFVNEADRDGHKRGWTGCLDSLERYLS
jgi:uncharacterized protein YndB with AHSA1/START domain